jgi:DNA-binding GntR family transcriptional regulator
VKQVASTSLTSQVLVALRAAILNEELPPGSLHSVHTLAAQLGVSRTPVREALITLAEQGMVRFERNRGFRILQTTLHDLEEVFQLRLLLEVPATYRAVQLMDPADRQQLRQQYAAMERAAASGDEQRLWDRDRRFHEILLAASGNQRLIRYVDGLRDTVLMRGASTAGRSRTLHDIVVEHQAILERVEAGDAAGAAAAMRAHLEHTARLLVAQEAGPAVGRQLLDLDWTAFRPPAGP